MDTSLNEVGKKQAIDLSNCLCTMKIDKVFCSNLIRAKQTIEPFLERKPDIPCQYFSELQENCMGTLSGLTWDEIKLKLKQEKTSLDDYGESKIEFIQRIMNFWENVILPMQGHISTILIVTHGGYIATLVNQLSKLGFLNVPKNIVITGSPKNCSISAINVSNKSSYELISYSDVMHLFYSQEIIVGVDYKKIENSNLSI